MFVALRDEAPVFGEILRLRRRTIAAPQAMWMEIGDGEMRLRTAQDGADITNAALLGCARAARPRHPSWPRAVSCQSANGRRCTVGVTKNKRKDITKPDSLGEWHATNTTIATRCLLLAGSLLPIITVALR